MKILFPIFILILSASVFGQVPLKSVATQCEESLTSTNLRRFQLGMTVTEVRRIYPEIFIPKADDTGQSETGVYLIKSRFNIPKNSPLNYLSFTKYPVLKGLESISLTFIDLKLSNIMLAYEPDQWEKIEDFAEAVADKMNFPNSWEYSNSDGVKMAKINCNNYAIVAGLGRPDEFQSRNPFIYVGDLRLMALAAARTEKLNETTKEKRKKIFKP